MPWAFRLSSNLSYYKCMFLTARVTPPMFHFVHLILHFYDYNMCIESLLPANLCLVTLLTKLGTIFAI